MKKLTLIPLFTLGLSLFVTAQKTDFSNFTPIQSRGDMPDDFALMTFEKVNEEKDIVIDGLGKKESKEFIKGIHYGIDEILRSGRVIYGDEMTEYVTRVGEKITGKNSDIRFYILRSNVVNAFSTKQGIIFVTEGLLAQLSNEAQLAFVLAHEIAHYQKEHVVEGYKENVEIARSRVNNDSKIKQLSQYSKEKEFEADGVGIELYNAAGYSKEELFDVFDVLLYSYLPFDLKSIPSTYWNTDHLVIPESYFETEFPDISVEKDYDDSKSSHPNIQSRSEMILDIIENINNWGEARFLLPEEDFYHVRNIARFETVRNDLYAFRYGDAIYSIYLLEQEFPNNKYLQICKAKAWAGLLAFKVEGRYTSVTTSPSKVQGDPHQLHQLLKKLDKKQLVTVAFRQVADIKQQFPEDGEVEAIYQYAIQHLAREKNFKISDYYEISYQEAYDAFQKSLDELNQADSLTSTDTTAVIKEEKELSKYEKIKRSTGAKEVATSKDDKFDEDDFYLYALNDIIKDDHFKQSYDSHKSDLEAKEEEEEKKRQLAYSERKQLKKQEEKEKIQMGLEEIILLEPRAIQVKGNDIDIEKSEKLEIDLREVVERFHGNSNVSVYKVGSLEYKSHGTYMYNQKAALVNSLSHLIEYEEVSVFPVDYNLNKEIINDFGTGKVAFIIVQSVHQRLSPRKIVFYSILPPVWLIAGPVTFMKSFYTNFGVAVFDLDTYAFNVFTNQQISGFTSKMEMEALMYDFLNQINKTTDQ